MNGAELLVSALENEGVEQIFGIPGEENLDVVEALRRSKIKLVLTRHEQAAAFMAATYGRLTGRPGVCLATLGPGRAQSDHRRRLCAARRDADGVITGQKGILQPQAGAFQLVDIVATMTPLTKMARQIVSPATIPDAGARSVPRRAAGAAGPGSSRTAGGHRRRDGAGHDAGPAAPDRVAGRAGRRARPRGRS